MAEIFLGELLSVLSPTGNIRIFNSDYVTVFTGTVLNFLRYFIDKELIEYALHRRKIRKRYYTAF